MKTILLIILIICMITTSNVLSDLLSYKIFGGGKDDTR